MHHALTPHPLLDAVRAELELPSDYRLSKLTGITCPNLSKIRSGKIGAGPSLILRIHELAPEAFPVKRIRELLAQEAV
jgi:hypothetical protein